jgi:nicotinic acid phosphoribosyltransferase
MSKFSQFLKIAVISGCSATFIYALIKISKLKKIRKILKNKKMPNLHEVKTICESLTGHQMTEQDLKKLESNQEFLPLYLENQKSFNFEIYNKKENSSAILQKDLSKNVFELSINNKSKSLL